MSTLLNAQAGASTTSDHAVEFHGDPDDAEPWALRNMSVTRTTLCGRAGNPRPRLFDVSSPRACKRCAAKAHE